MAFSKYASIQLYSNYYTFVSENLNSSPLTPEPFGKLATGLSLIDADRAPPHDCHAPADVQQRIDCCQITLSIGIELTVPEICSGLRQSKERAALMTVPKASVHENQGFPFGQHQIRFPREILGM